MSGVLWSVCHFFPWSLCIACALCPTRCAAVCSLVRAAGRCCFLPLWWRAAHCENTNTQDKSKRIAMI